MGVALGHGSDAILDGLDLLWDGGRSAFSIILILIHIDEKDEVIGDPGT